MAKEKETGAGDIGVKPVVVGGGQVKAASIPNKILSAEDAKILIDLKYSHLKGINTWVTEDRSVFEEQKHAVNHASRQKLQIFTVIWQD